LGSDNCVKIVKNLKNYLLKNNVHLIFNTKVKNILSEKNIVKGVLTDSGELIKAKYVVAAPGRSGANWLKQEACRLGIKWKSRSVDLGVRVECPAEIMEKFTNVLYEPKIVYYTRRFDDKVRLFCVCPHGEVIAESYNGIVTVNGQSRRDYKTENTNFAVLVSTSFTEPFKDPVSYALNLAQIANNLAGGKPIVQRLGDLIRGRRSTEERISRSIVRRTLLDSVAGDLSFVFPFRYLYNIIEMLRALNKVMPGLYSDHTLLYGVEVKLYSFKFQLNSNLETPVKNLFFGGDGGGVSRGLVQAAASGVVIARSILEREREK